MVPRFKATAIHRGTKTIDLRRKGLQNGGRRVQLSRVRQSSLIPAFVLGSQTVKVLAC